MTDLEGTSDVTDNVHMQITTELKRITNEICTTFGSQFIYIAMLLHLLHLKRMKWLYTKYLCAIIVIYA